MKPFSQRLLKSEVRNPKSERNPKPEARTAALRQVAGAHCFRRVSKAGFGLRISSFFRISGIRISEFRFIPAFLLSTFVASFPVEAATKPVRVFILAGQSNMEGHGIVAADPKRNGGKGSLEFVAKDPATAKHFAPLLDAAGKWRTRDDVFITYLDRKGPFTVGYGASELKIGPELGFGWVMGDALDEPVLLIKCSWGGKSLAVDFRRHRVQLAAASSACDFFAGQLERHSCARTPSGGETERHWHHQRRALWQRVVQRP